ncbi:MAG: DUF805 domain-containing protein [Actinomycetales bacterium]|nr:DUF805 domain-containing protein [Actinomycetales bacterium]
MSFTESVRTCFNKFGTFEGRATRSEFWWFYLFVILVGMVFYVPILILTVIGTATDGNGGAVSGVFTVLTVIFWIVWILFMIALYIPTLAVGCRRLHDRGQSGWLQLLLLVPCGNIVLIVLWALEGTPGDNMYGPKPVS